MKCITNVVNVCYILFQFSLYVALYSLEKPIFLYTLHCGYCPLRIASVLPLYGIILLRRTYMD